MAQLTNGVVPSVDGKQAAAGDSDHSRYGQVREGVCDHVRYGGIGWKLQHHDDILLHLVLEHERTLWRETLLSRRKKRWWVGWTDERVRKEEADVKRYSAYGKLWERINGMV